MTPSQHPKSRCAAYDIIRIVAILMVILVHICARFLLNYDNATLPYVLGNLLNGLSRAGVPLFLMLSGALMLNEDKAVPAKKVLRSALEIFGLLVVWSVFYAAVHHLALPFVRGEALSLSGFFYAIYEGHFHLWYLFVIIGLYLLTPILRLFVKRDNASYVKYLLLLAVVVRFAVPLLNFLVNRFVGGTDLVAGYADKFQLSFMGEYLTYYLLGWYVVNVPLSLPTRRWMYVGGGLGLATTLLLTQFFADKENQLFYLFESYGIINVLAPSVAIFVFLYYAFKDKANFSPFVTTLSKLSFGVYILHIVVMNVLIMVLDRITAVPLWIAATFLLTTVVSFVATFLLSNIPLVKKLVRG